MRYECRNLWVMTGAVFLILSHSPSTSAQKEKSNAVAPGRQQAHLEAQISVDVFIGKDRAIIQRYYAARPETLPPGLAKRGGNLPPGLEKQLLRKGHLPPGLDKRIRAFPVELERRLAPLKPGLMRGVVYGQAVIYSPRASVILDVFVIL